MKSIPKNHLQLVGRVRVGPRGQVVIPAETRASLGIEPGEYMLAIHVADSEAIAFVKEDKLQALIEQSSGSLKHSLSRLKEKK